MLTENNGCSGSSSAMSVALRLHVCYAARNKGHRRGIVHWDPPAKIYGTARVIHEGRGLMLRQPSGFRADSTTQFHQFLTLGVSFVASAIQVGRDF